MDAPKWVPKTVVLALHEVQLAEHGGQGGLRDEGLLDSALGRPQNLFAYGNKPTICALAASYAYGIARNHPFIDGNKRASFVVCDVFLRANGLKISASQIEIVNIWLGLAAGSVDEDTMERWIGENTLPLN